MPQKEKTVLYSSQYPTAEITQMNAQLMSPPGPASPTMHQLLGPSNTVAVCMFCSAHIKTAVKYTINTRTHMAAALWGLICCCCCLPYVMDSAKNADHYCPNCQRYLGTYQK